MTAAPPSVLMIFVDGLGLGSRASPCNPLAAFSPRVLRCFREELGPFPRGGKGMVTDACLGVAGLPQSATGQTSLYTGLNASALLGYHWPAYPNERLRQMIARHSIFRKLVEGARKVVFANTYTPRFFQRPPRWLSATTIMSLTAGVPLLGLKELLEERSLYMDFTNGLLRRNGFQVPPRTPEEAGRILVRIAEGCDFCLYEYFLTDLVGHRGNLSQAVDLLRDLDRFLGAVLEAADLSRLSVVLVSDHGNIEAMDHTRHTTNPVPSLWWGPLSARLPEQAGFSLPHISPLLEGFLSGRAG